MVPSLHNHLQPVKAHSLLLAVAFSERMCQVANTATSIENDSSLPIPWEPFGPHSYTWERLYGMLSLKAKEAAFWGR